MTISKLASPYLMILTFSCYILACSTPKTTEPVKQFPIGDYQYVGSDEKGNRVVEGRVSITSVAQVRIGSEVTTQIKGNWQLKRTGGQEKIGPQEGAGDLIGSIIKGEIFINLNPNIDDANVNLRGTIEGSRFHGTWTFDGYAGALSKGTFEATRK
jgi:hypothetical protein